MKLKYQKWVAKHIGTLANKKYLVTGANSGIGFFVCMYLAFLGADVVMACRNKAKAEIAKQKILNLFPQTQAEIILYDQSSFRSLDLAINEITRNFPNLDGIVLNAGIFHPKKGQKTIEGHNKTIGTNFLGCYYFVENLKEYLLSSPNTRLVFVTSLVYKTKKKITPEVFVSEYKDKFAEYAISKKLLTSYAYYLASAEPKIHVELVHPGVASTNIYSSKDTSFSKWFTKLAHLILPLFTSPPQKASLAILQGLTVDRKKELGVYGPRGMWEIAGYPKYRKIQKKIIKENEEIMKVVHDFMQSEEV